MDIYASDEEKSEAIKQWWRENGMAVAAGIVLGIIAIFGTRYWFSYQADQAEQAAVIYQQTLVTMSEGDLQQAQSTVSELQTEFSGTPYAVFATTELATRLANNDDLDAAMQQLQWVIDNADFAPQRDLARLRLARLKMDAEDFEAALQLTQQAQTKGFASLFAELQGDIYAAQNAAEQAYEAYQTALNMISSNDPRYGLLQMKRDDVAVQ
ncbi:MAG TPA: tetratricopeptide repeat protein [Methylophaga sp.]|nr:tetratricopeptide repeat protein [Methylophaga sp.]